MSAAGELSPPQKQAKRDGSQPMNVQTNSSYRPYWYSFALCLLWLFSHSTLAASLSATVERTHISSEETVELRVRYDGQTTGEPDFSPLEQDFEILSRDKQNQVSFINGNLMSYTEWRLQLWPQKKGALIIPPLTFKGEKTNPITLKVEARATIHQQNHPVYIETLLDKPSAFVQEQLLLTLRIVSSTNLQGLSGEELMVKNASITKVSETQHQENINGINHLVIETKYAIFPNTSGEFTIPSVRFNVMLSGNRRDPFSGSFFSRGGKQLILQSEEKKAIIKPKPTQFGPSEWLPAKGIALNERWSRPLDELVAGEPITRTIYITAQGLTSAQLPPIEINAGEIFKVYPDQPQLKDDVSQSGVTGTRAESVAIVPSKEGTIQLPPIVIKWWDTESNTVKETRLTGTTLSVKPAVNASTDIELPEESPATPDKAVASLEKTEGIDRKQPKGILIWILGISNLVLAIIVIILAVLWRQARTPSTEVPTQNPDTLIPSPEKEAELFNRLRQASRSNDYRQFRENLIIWARAFWQQPLVTLDEVLQKTNEPSLQDRFRQLDQALYQTGRTETADLTSLYNDLKSVRKSGRERDSGNKHLKPLYDNS